MNRQERKVDQRELFHLTTYSVLYWDQFHLISVLIFLFAPTFSGMTSPFPGSDTGFFVLFPSDGYYTRKLDRIMQLAYIHYTHNLWDFQLFRDGLFHRFYDILAHKHRRNLFELEALVEYARFYGDVNIVLLEARKLLIHFSLSVYISCDVPYLWKIDRIFNYKIRNLVHLKRDR